jgi:hypothetical protein
MVKTALYVRLEAKPGKEQQVEDLDMKLLSQIAVILRVVTLEGAKCHRQKVFYGTF